MLDAWMYVPLGIVVIWVLAKVIGKSSSAYVEKDIFAGADARAVREAVDSVGTYDGGPESRRRVVSTVADLVENGPFPMGNRGVDDLVQACMAGLATTGGPILLEAAWSVVGSHRFEFRGEPGPQTRAERDQALHDTALFSALFPDWTKTMVRQYRVGTPAALRESQRRMALVVELILDRCERFGTLPQG